MPEIDKSRASRLMRELPQDVRDKLISETPNCIDGRKRFRQRELAVNYRKPNNPGDIA